MTKAFGDDSKDWMGKPLDVEIVRQKVFKEMKNVIYLSPQGMNEEKIEEETLPNEPEETE